MAMAPRGGFEDEELTISLSSSHVRRLQQQPPAPHHHRRHQGREDAPKPPKPSSGRQNMESSRDKTKTEQRIGAYKIVRTLGEGSFGKVRLAIHQGTGQQVALKIIARKKLISRDMAGRVEREIEYLQLLRHPHIIKLYVAPSPCTVVTQTLPMQTRLLTDPMHLYTGTPLSRPTPKSSWCSSTLAENCLTTLFKMAA